MRVTFPLWFGETLSHARVAPGMKWKWTPRAVSRPQGRASGSAAWVTVWVGVMNSPAKQTLSRVHRALWKIHVFKYKIEVAICSAGGLLPTVLCCIGQAVSAHLTDWSTACGLLALYAVKAYGDIFDLKLPIADQLSYSFKYTFGCFKCFFFFIIFKQTCKYPVFLPYIFFVEWGKKN